MVTAPQSGAERELRIMRVEREIVAPLHGLLGPESSLSFTADEAEARAKISSGEAAAAVLVRATPMSDVVETADEGGIMPPKTTHFFPKVPSGLVLWPVT